MSEETAARLFAGNITAFRKQRGLSQYDLADITGISRRMIGHYENEGIIPPMDRLQALANALEVPVSHLFEDKKQSPHPLILPALIPGA
jgi:transcriptional regulator with XRE-family HTH domain